jgi:hypothetical protein
MDDDAFLLSMARRCAEQALTRLLNRPDLIAKRRARIAAIRAGNADGSPEVQAVMIVLGLVANGQLTDSCCKPSVTTRCADDEVKSGGDVKMENDCRAPP